MTEQSYPADLQAILNELDRTDAEARQLVSTLTEAQLNWQPGGGTGWSVAQCLDHLAQSTALYAPALLEAVRKAKIKASSRRARTPIQPPWLGRWFIRDLEPPPKRKFKSPKKVKPAAQQFKSAEVLKAFLAAHDQVRVVIEEAREVDLNRVRFRNPLLRFLPWTVGTGLLILGAHDRRHLWQAQQVLKTMQEPSEAKAR
ncbi:MAG TPA: DinB family protein [Candidatus Angelobacter sp.]|nr:DinB family protein [Candidatus Angelobacter sp.]